ncbi:serine/threonine-protein kinase [Bifidobacterium sp.]|uniref:serine/threonine-protein kinase n=1 Tax=Bifidobacterium sp. TaxID=41200 RepID=UPI003D7DCAAC
MEASRSVPPQIPGYTLVRRLGSGSEADVYLYQQLSPSRQVAIKISKGRLDSQSVTRFRSEADLMGQISSHPNILTVYANGVTATGSGYTVFEYAPGGNYKSFLEHDRLTVDQMLDLGIRLASALFTAHRRGIIHRDIKPSNILISAQGMPLLSDFGIAVSVYGRPGIGFTIAWAAPEVLAQGGGGKEASDIYSLGATLFATLTGRSPYEYFYADLLGDSKGKERAERLKTIILNDPLPKFNRPDIPPQVERALRKALDKTPENRFYSALEFARTLQNVQYELYGHMTQTIIEGVPNYPRHPHRRRDSGNAIPQTTRRPSWVRPVAIGLSVAAALVALILSFAFVVAPNMDTASDGSTTQVRNRGVGDPAGDDPDSAITEGGVPSVRDLTGTYIPDGGKVSFTWVNPSPEQGDSYVWSPVGDSDSDPNSQGTVTKSTHIEIDPSDGAQTCIQVSLVRANRQMSEKPEISCVANQ